MTTSKEDPAKSRRGNQEGSEPKLRKNGYWQANYVAGYKPSGQPVRKSVYGKTKAECTRKLREALRDVQDGNVPLERAPKLIEWLDYWLVHIAPRTAQKKTVEEYKNRIDLHLRKHRVANKRLDKLTPKDFDAIYADMTKPKELVPGKRVQQTGQATAAGLHRILRRALNMAVKRGVLPRNPILRVDSPKAEDFTSTVYSTAEVRRMLATAQSMDYGARWILNLTIGLRQSEALGLAWSDLDLKARRIRVERKLYTMTWKHGCPGADDGSPTCGRKQGDRCPQRKDGGFFMGPTKSKAGWRTAPMPAELASALEVHREVQLLQRKDWAPYVDQDGKEHDLVFCQPNGQPLHAHSDWAAWKDFLALAKVPDGRVHDGRHTAATTLLLLGVPERVVMEILGWSQISMLARYQHVLDEMHADVEAKLSGHLFQAEETSSPEPTPPSNVVSLADRLKARQEGA